MQITFQKADGLLPRSVVAKSDVDVTVDETGNCCHLVGIDDDVGLRDMIGGAGADEGDLAAFANDGIALNQRIAPIAADNRADIHDCRAN